LTPIQDALINTNLMAIAVKSRNLNYSKRFDDNNVEKLSLFKSQKQQIFANAYNYGFELSHAQKKLIKCDNECQMNESPANFIEFLKKNFNSIKKKPKETKGIKSNTNTKVSKPLDKERWIPLRDRSYYKTKAKYLKSVASKKISSSK
jgi:hypothetical protein